MTVASRQGSGLMICKFLSVVGRQGDVSAGGAGFLLFSVVWWGFRVVTRMLIWG
ncbi:hypothetical protein [Streptomyces sp. NPDC050388]|uniref:hypothetical protein n=1 Tax=Streptomyces sp. NPDC050388 TaxID=3155781 RepID=UPI00341C288B